MKKIIKQSIPLIISLAGILLWYFSFECVKYACSLGALMRNGIYLDLVRIIGALCLPLIVSTVFLPVVSKETFKMWTKAMLILFPIILILIVFVSDSSMGASPLFSYGKSEVALLGGTLLTLVGLVVVVKKSFFSRK